jgi:hypothetical protein
MDQEDRLEESHVVVRRTFLDLQWSGCFGNVEDLARLAGQALEKSGNYRSLFEPGEVTDVALQRQAKVVIEPACARCPRGASQRRRQSARHDPLDVVGPRGMTGATQELIDLSVDQRWKESLLAPFDLTL